jgi:hypothetical protein
MPDGLGADTWPRLSRTGGAAWAGFLAAAFAVVGMIGLVGTYSAPLPYQREARREVVLDQVLVTPPGQQEGLREALGDSADAVLKGDGPIAPRVAAERAAMRVRFAAEADATAQSLRLLIVVVTLMAAIFGALALGMQRRG